MLTINSRCPYFAVTILLSGLLLSGCIRLAGGAFYAKKEKPDEPPKVKEIYLDTNELLRKKPPGKIE